MDPIAVKGAKEDLREMAGEQGFEGPVILDEDESLTRALGAHDYGHLRFGFRPTVLYRGPIDDQYGIGYQLDQPRRQYLKEAGRPPDPQADPIHRLVGSGMRVGRLPAKDPKQQAWTYHNRISRILEANCVECHREGGVGPFGLEHYDEAEENAGMIRKVVSEGIAPLVCLRPTRRTSLALGQ